MLTFVSRATDYIESVEVEAEVPPTFRNICQQQNKHGWWNFCKNPKNTHFVSPAKYLRPDEKVEISLKQVELLVPKI